MIEVLSNISIVNLRIRQFMARHKSIPHNGKCPWCNSEVAEHSIFIGGMGVGTYACCVRCNYEIEYGGGIDGN